MKASQALREHVGQHDLFAVGFGFDRTWAAAGLKFELDHPAPLIELLVVELKGWEANAMVNEAGALVKAQKVRGLLEEIATTCGNDAVWGPDRKNREDQQNKRVIAATNARIRDFENEGQTDRAVRWADALQSFRNNECGPLQALTEGLDPEVYNILRARMI